MNKGLRFLTDWIRANKLSLNESKTNLLISRPTSKLSIKLDDHLLTPGKSHTLASRLTGHFPLTNKLKLLQKNLIEHLESYQNFDITFPLKR